MKKKTIITVSGTNSILKYFGSKVEKAIAQPSRTMNAVIDVDLGLNVSSMTISSTVVNLPSQILSEDLALTIRCVKDTPPTQVQPVIETTPMTVSHAVIEQDERNKEVLYGFFWAKKSCSFDTVLTVLLFFYTSLSLSQQEDFLHALQLFEIISPNIVTSSLSYLRQTFI